jgi:hypothetical protein
MLIAVAFVIGFLYRRLLEHGAPKPKIPAKPVFERELDGGRGARPPDRILPRAAPPSHRFALFFRISSSLSTTSESN